MASPSPLPVAEPPIADGVVVVEGESIAWLGRRVDLPEAYHAARIRAFPQALLLPGFMGSDTYLSILSGWLTRVGYRPANTGGGTSVGSFQALLQHAEHQVQDGRAPHREFG